MRKGCGRLLAVLTLIVAAQTLSLAQSRATGGDLVGRVLDQLQGAMVAVQISARNLATNVERTATTDERGQFAIPLLAPGTYELTVAASGFSKYTRAITIELGTVVDVDITLALAPTAETVTVSGENTVVDLRRTTVGGQVDSRQIEQLPIDLRNFMSFATITAGVNFDQTPQQGATATSGLTFAGQRGRSNNITVDGLDNNEAGAGGVRAVFSQEAVREFQVLTSSFPAEFGNASGGVVNIVTKSGTNVLGGSAFVFMRDDSLNAKGHFDTLQKAPYRQTQAGATIGGPIRKDKMFFFGSYERRDVAATNLVTIDDQTAAVLRTAGFSIETGHVPYDRQFDQLLVKTDQYFAQGQSLAIRFHGVDTLDENVEPFGGIVARSRAAALDATDYALAASHTTVFRAHWLNELRVQASYRDQVVRALDPACGGPCLRVDQGGPTIEVAGAASVGRHRFTPQHRRSLNYQFLETMNLFRNNHAMKAGAELILRDHIPTDATLPLHFGGRYIFTALPAIPGVLPAPVSATQALALGLPAAYVQGYGSDQVELNGYDVALFAQDDWRPAPRLTIRYGLRYQYQGWGNTPLTLNGYPATYRFPRDGNDIAPRLGLAWDVRGDRRTLIHSAYGIYHDRHPRLMEGASRVLDGGAHVRTLAARFPNPQVRMAWNSPGRQLPESAAGRFASVQFGIDPDMKTPYAHHFSLGVDRELPQAVRLSINFVSVRGHQQVATIDFNPRVPALGPNRRPLDEGGIPDTSASVLQYTSAGKTWYDGLVVALEKRLQSRHQFTVSYTLSKAEDTSTDFQSAFIPQQNGQGRNPQDPEGLPVGFDPMRERGPSTQDQRHRFVASAVLSLPAAFTVSAITTLASGRPYTILAGVDVNGDGDGGGFPADRARANPLDESTSVGRNSGRMPAQSINDVRVSRRFRFGGRVQVDAMLEVFNLFNRTNFQEPSNISPAFIFGTGAYPGQPLSTFEQFTQAGPPRQVQLGLRLTF